MIQVIFTIGREVVQYLAHTRLREHGLHASDTGHTASALQPDPDRLEHEQLIVLQQVVVGGGRLLRLCIQEGLPEDFTLAYVEFIAWIQVRGRIVTLYLSWGKATQLFGILVTCRSGDGGELWIVYSIFRLGLCCCMFCAFVGVSCARAWLLQRPTDLGGW